MSRSPRLIQDVLDVLAEMRTLYTGRYRGRPLGEIRAEATGSVATRTGRVPTTVHDSLARRLGLKADEFDRLADGWLGGQPERLCQLLEQHAANSTERARIAEFFGGPTLIAQLPVSPSSTKLPIRRRTPHPVAVVLDADVAEAFMTQKEVNDALRALLRIANRATGRRVG